MNVDMTGESKTGSEAGERECRGTCRGSDVIKLRSEMRGQRSDCRELQLRR